MLKNIFREYDIRGIFQEELNEKTVKAIGFELGKIMKEKGVKTLSLGIDARTSGIQLFEWLISGLNLSELKLFSIGKVPTPVGYFSTFTKEFDANIMITGSHNPKNYNGFKITIFDDSFYGEDLRKLGEKVEEFLAKNEEIEDNFKHETFNILDKYIAYLEKTFAHLKNFKNSYVVDCANGVAGISAKKITEALNLNVKYLFEDPDGTFPNHHPDPSERKNLKDLERELESGKFSLAFGFDGDADRIALLSPNKIFKGDEIGALLALNIKNPFVIGEVKCSSAMYDFIEELGGKTLMAKTGHSNIKKALKEEKADLGVEVSGHIFFKERYLGFDDALYAMLRIIELEYLGFNLEEEVKKLPNLYSTEEIKFPSSEAEKFKLVEKVGEFLEDKEKVKSLNLPEIEDILKIDGLRIIFKNAFALIRASNTTPIIVLRFEGKDKEFTDKVEKTIRELLEKVRS